MMENANASERNDFLRFAQKEDRDSSEEARSDVILVKDTSKNSLTREAFAASTTADKPGQEYACTTEGTSVAVFVAQELSRSSSTDSGCEVVYDGRASAENQDDDLDLEQCVETERRPVSKKLPAHLCGNLKRYVRNFVHHQVCDIKPNRHLSKETDFPIRPENLAAASRICGEWLTANPSNPEINPDTLADQAVSALKQMWPAAIRRSLKNRTRRQQSAANKERGDAPKRVVASGSLGPGAPTGQFAFADYEMDAVAPLVIPKSLRGNPFSDVVAAHGLPPGVFNKVKEMVSAAVGAYKKAIHDNVDYVIERQDEHIRDIIAVLSHMVDTQFEPQQTEELKAKISATVPAFWELRHRVVRQRYVSRADWKSAKKREGCDQPQSSGFWSVSGVCQGPSSVKSQQQLSFVASAQTIPGCSQGVVVPLEPNASTQTKLTSTPAPKFTFPAKNNSASSAVKNGDRVIEEEEDIIFLEQVNPKRRKRGPIITELNLPPISFEKLPANGSVNPDLSAHKNEISEKPTKAQDNGVDSIEKLLDMFGDNEEDDDISCII